MDEVAAQERTGMLSRSMTEGGIRIGSSPSEDGSTINNQGAGTNQPTTDGGQDAEHEERFRQWGSGALPALALLRRARNAGVAILAQRPAALQCKRGPVTLPVAHI